ncbi:TolC family protein [Qipengyuania spongiae]|uniref:TolC family protein n=1 Tax=Qipengyuania spongiae TaxID=2909673 RepID=UPI003B96CAA2
MIAAERDAIAQVRAAYSSWHASLAIIESSQTAVEAASLSLEGVRAENSIGNRTILDVSSSNAQIPGGAQCCNAKADFALDQSMAICW